jgi:hypothetical protein
MPEQPASANAAVTLPKQGDLLTQPIHSAKPATPGHESKPAATEPVNERKDDSHH